MVFGSEERTKQMEKQKRKREKRTEVPRQWREKFRGWNKIYIYFLEFCYSTILTLELYCSTNTKNALDMALAFFNANALTSGLSKAIQVYNRAL